MVKVNPALLGEEPQIEATAVDEADAGEVAASESDEVDKLRARIAELEAKAAAVRLPVGGSGAH